MGVSTIVKDIKGVVTVQVEGFFTERFINLCKINNIKIWDIRQIVQGVIRIKMYISDFKKLRHIARKTKCKVIIKDKKGIYFSLFKMKKKKFLIYSTISLIIFSIIFSMFIWQINITGNTTIQTQKILNKLKDSGIYVGKFKIGLSKKEVINKLRVSMPELSWAGIEVSGVKANVEVVEKTIINQKIDQTTLGDIVADKSGVITRIIAENGTAKLKEGSYIENGYTLIEGIILSKILPIQYVHAEGIVRINSEYIFEKDYKFEQIEKNYTGTKKYTIGIGINNKENMLNYLNKNKKYDITKTSKKINIFSTNISFDLYKCEEYIEKNVTYSKEQVISQGQNDAKEYIDNIMSGLNSAYFVDEKEQVVDIDSGIKYRKIYKINEQIGKFVERNYQ